MLVVILAGCVPKTLGEQASHYNDRTGGHLDGSFEPTDKDRGTYAQSPQDGHGMELYVSGGTVCARQEWGDRIWFKATAESLTAGRQRYASQVVVAFGAYSTLGAYGSGPDQASGKPGKLRSAKAKEEFRENNVPGTGSMWLNSVLEWCGPMPAIAADTKYITVSKWAPDYKHPALFVWKIKGTPTATAGPASTPDAPTTQDAPTERPSKPTKVSGGTALDLLRKEGLDKFIAVAEAAGKQADLEAGNLVVLAVYDNAFPGGSGAYDALLADKRRAAALFDDLVSDATVTKQQLIDKGSVTVTTRSGRKVTLGMKKDRPTVDGKKDGGRLYEGQGWLVITTFSVAYPP